jgi:acetyltransferase-like isoleucine patch superfamily enzyme
MPILPFKDIRPKIAEGVFIAPSAVIIGDVTIHEGASVWFNAVIRGDSAPIVIGPHSNIQDNCTLHADPGAPVKRPGPIMSPFRALRAAREPRHSLRSSTREAHGRSGLPRRTRPWS